jgi:hypothetical protein
MFYRKDPEIIPAARKIADDVFSEKWERFLAPGRVSVSVYGGSRMSYVFWTSV